MFTCRNAAILFAISLWAASGFAGDWSRFRGPEGNALAEFDALRKR